MPDLSPEDRDPVDRAVDNLLVVLGNVSEDAIEDAAMQTWHGGEDNWLEGDDGGRREAHSDATWRDVAKRLGLRLIELSEAP